jgi:hypothetical protein
MKDFWNNRYQDEEYAYGAALLTPIDREKFFYRRKTRAGMR